MEIVNLLLAARWRAAAPAPPRPAGAGGSAPTLPEDDDRFSDPDFGDSHKAPKTPAFTIGCRRVHRSYWLATMHHIGIVCALTLSVIDTASG